MTPQIASFDTFGYAGGYPLAVSSSFDAGSATAVIVALTTSNGYSFLPTASYGGQPMTLLARTSTSDTGKTTTWMWGLVSPPAGNQTISIAASEYCAPATGIVIALEETAAAPFGETNAGIGLPTLTLSVDTSAADCLLIAVGQSQSTSGVALTANNGFSLIVSASEGATTNILSAFEKAAASPGTWPVTLTAPFNNVSGALIAVHGTGSEGTGIAGIAGSSATGTPAVIADRSAAIAGIGGSAAFGLPGLRITGQETAAGIAPSSAMGSPSIVSDAVATIGGIPSASAVGSPDIVQAGTFPLTLQPGETLAFRVTFAPATAGAKSGTLVLDTSIGLKTLALSGTGAAVAPEPEPVALPRLSTLGNQFVDEDGVPVRLRTVNWHGAESGNQLPHAMWGGGDVTAFHWPLMLDRIKSFGFNCIRFPFSGDDCCADGAVPPQNSISTANADLKGLGTFDAWERLFDYCADIGLYVVLDYHRNAPGYGAPPGAFTDKATWIANWVRVATRFASHPAVVGADVFNEPYQYTWAQWAQHAEDCGNAIHAVAPEWIIFVEGTMGENGDTTWWGGHLKGVATRPVVLAVPNKLAYSPHEYGQSVGSQSWLSKNGNVPANWPNNLNAVWRSFWGFIFEEGIAPIWIGEYGGHFGYDPNTGADGAEPHATEERQWLATLIAYLNGDFDGDGVPDLSGAQAGMSCSYWCYSPLSGDTGGLVLADHLTPQTGKLALLAPLLED